jgi:hypothetical protein
MMISLSVIPRVIRGGTDHNCPCIINNVKAQVLLLRLYWHIFLSLISIAWSVYQTVDQVGIFIQSPWSFQFSNCSANLTISNPIRTLNCNLETVKNESMLTSAIFFSILADWVTETVGIQNTYSARG